MSSGTDPRAVWLLAATFAVAVAGLIYELIAATISSYLLGDSVRQFSFVIGVFLTSMGAGAALSRFVSDPVRGFVLAQLALGIIGGAVGPVMFFVYAGYGIVGLPLYSALIAIGVLSGMEIPLIARVLKDIGAAAFRFENVLTADYIGALVASLAFPLLVIPYLSLIAASLAFGVLNLLVAGFTIWLFRDHLSRLFLPWGVALAVALLALVGSDRLVATVDAALFADDVIYSEETAYQSIIVTRFRDRVRLFLDHSIQFDSRDEHRYHEALVHPAMGQVARPRSVLILGGGDGMALREVLRHDDVETVTLVDLDPAVTRLFRDHPDLSTLNEGAFSDPRVSVLNQDAWTFMAEDNGRYDVVIADLPDPRTLGLSKLYSLEFYAMTVERLSAGGVIVTQAGSPTFARAAFWTVVETLEATRNPDAPGEEIATRPYHVYVPSFGDWGFVLASPGGFGSRVPDLPEDLVFLSAEVWDAAQVFGADQGPIPAEPNSIDTHVLLRLYEEGWSEWFE